MSIILQKLDDIQLSNFYYNLSIAFNSVGNNYIINELELIHKEILKRKNKKDMETKHEMNLTKLTDKQLSDMYDDLNNKIKSMSKKGFTSVSLVEEHRKLTKISIEIASRKYKKDMEGEQEFKYNIGDTVDFYDKLNRALVKCEVVKRLNIYDSNRYMLRRTYTDVYIALEDEMTIINNE